MPGSDGLRIWVFWKRRVGSRLWAGRVSSLLRTSPVGCRMGTGRAGNRLGPCRRTVEVVFRPECWLMVWEPGFNPWSSTKDSKMVLDAALLNTQYYKVSIKGKEEQFREGVAPSPINDTGYFLWGECSLMVWELGFNPRSSHTKDSKNSTWCQLA